MESLDLEALPLVAHLGITVAAALAVWRGGTGLARHGDDLAERMGWSRALVGMLLLGGLTELPELVTTVAAALGDRADLAANNLFGGIALQTAILVLADLSLARGPLTYFTPSPTLLLQGLLLVLLLALTLGFLALGEPLVLLGVGAWSAALLAAYVGAVAILRRSSPREAWLPVDRPEPPPDRPTPTTERGRPSTRTLLARLAGAALLVLLGGVLVVRSADVIAERTGIGSSFVGATLLAGTTSLPELSTTLAAVRLGAYELAVANVFGSNAIMVALLFPVDAAYRGGPLLEAIDASARFSAIAGIAVTTVYLVGLVERRDRSWLRLGLDSWAVVVLYGATLAALYALG